MYVLNITSRSAGRVVSACSHSGDSFSRARLSTMKLCHIFALDTRQFTRRDWRAV